MAAIKMQPLVVDMGTLTRRSLTEEQFRALTKASVVKIIQPDYGGIYTRVTSETPFTHVLEFDYFVQFATIGYSGADAAATGAIFSVGIDRDGGYSCELVEY